MAGQKDMKRKWDRRRKTKEEVSEGQGGSER